MAKREKAIFGFNIGGTKTTIVVGAYEGEILHRVSFPTASEKGFAVSFDKICRAAERTLRWAKETKLPIDAISVCIGGPLDIQKGINHSPPNLPGWDNIHLKKFLQERFSLPVSIENGGNAGALAE